MAASSLALLGGTELISAKVLRWDLQNVTFEDGGTAHGFFLFDADAPRPAEGAPPLIDWDISVDERPIYFPGIRLTPANTPYGEILDISGGPAEPVFPAVYFVGPSFYDPIGRNVLELSLVLDHPLTDAGGAVALHTESRPRSNEFLSYTAVARFLITGEVVAIPEPSQVRLLSIAVLLFLFSALVRFLSRGAPLPHGLQPVPRRSENEDSAQNTTSSHHGGTGIGGCHGRRASVAGSVGLAGCDVR